MLILMIVCVPLVLGSVSEFGATEVEPGITEFTPVTEIIETSPSPSKTTFQFLIRSCESLVEEFTFENIPVLHSQFDYFEENILIDSKNPLEQCPFGGTPSKNVTILASIDQVPKNATKPGSLLRLVTVLLDNGYLSVGHDEKTLTYYSPQEYCLHAASNGRFTFRTCPVHESRAIIRKCCPIGMIVDGGCKLPPQNYTWSPQFMDSDTHKFVPFDKAHGVFTADRPESCAGGVDGLVINKDGCEKDMYPTTNNGFLFLMDDRSWKYIDAFTCFDTSYDGEKPVEFAYVCPDVKPLTEDNPGKPLPYVYLVSMIIAAVFHLLTSVVYLITWNSQNMNGRALCSCTISLFFTSMFAAVIYVYDMMQITQTTICVSIGIAAHYFQLCSFAWLFVVNYDVFQKFRKFINGKKGLKTFVAYSVFGWGLPAAVVTSSVVLNFTFTCSTSMVPIPGYGTRNCFIRRYSQGYYLYYILAALIAPSVALSVATLINLYKSSKEGSNLQSSKKQTETQHALMYIRLSVMMGVTWIFEVVSWIFIQDNNPHVIWVLLDVYNILSAILIFAFFVCKKRTLELLKKNPYLMQMIHSVVTSTSTDSK